MPNRWTIPPVGERGEPVPDWMIDAVNRGAVLRIADGSAMVPAATTSSCIAKRGDSIVRRRDGAVDIEPAMPSSIN